MKRYARLLAIITVLAIAPTAVHAKGAAVTSANGAFTWSVVQIVKQQVSVNTALVAKARDWFGNRHLQPNVSMGFFFGGADHPAHSVVGWDTSDRWNIASKVQYGLFLINRF